MLQTASGLAQDLVDKVRGISAAAWGNTYGVSKGAATAYFVNASGTKTFIIEGQESILSNDILTGLITHWKFDESTSTASLITYDSSGSGYHGSLIGGPKRATTTCKVGFCLNFDGTDDYVSVANSSNLPAIAPAGTIALWVNLDTLPISPNLYTLLDVDGTGCVSRGLFFYLSESQFSFQYGSGGVCRNANSITEPVANKWIQVVGTWDSSGGKIYVNGVFEGSNPAAPDFTITQANSFIGSQGGTLRFTDGLIDDVRIYNRPLTAEEIQRLYNSIVFTRYFSVENVLRDSGGNIVPSGGAEDPSTQKITTYVLWPGSGSAKGEVKVVDYITRWQNKIFQQTDWSGGAGQNGPLTEPNNKYSNATSVINEEGSLRIEGL